MVTKLFTNLSMDNYQSNDLVEQQQQDIVQDFSVLSKDTKIEIQIDPK